MECNNTIIDNWFKALLSLRNISNLKEFNHKYPCKAFSFPELIPLFKDESVSVENILLCLYKKGLVHIHKDVIAGITYAIQFKQSYNFNQIMFVLNETPTRKFLTPPNNQLDLSLNL